MAVFTPVTNPAAIAAVQDILKEVWISDTLETQLYEDTILLDWIEEVTEYTDSDGLRAVVPLRTGRTGGVSARAIGQKLAPADHQKVGRATYNYQNLYLQCEVYGPVIAKMETARQAAVREVDFEISNGVNDFKRDFTRQLQRKGDAVITVAGLPGGASSTTVLLGAANYELIDKGFLYEGQVIDIGTAASPTLDTSGVRVLSVVDSVAAPAIVVDNATATTAGSHISLFGNRTAGSVSNEINGLENIVDDTAVLGGIDPTVAGKAFWKSIRENNAGTPRALSLALMNTTNRKLRQKGARIDVILTDLVQEQKYYELLQAQVRFIGEMKLSAGNVEGPAYNNVPVIGDPDHRSGKMHFLTKKSLQMYSAGAMAWQNQTTGGDVLSWRQDFDAFVGRAAKYVQVGTNRRNLNGVLEDLI
jgi:hypothetical protein